MNTNFLTDHKHSLYQWNLTFTKVDLIYSLPPCYYEFIAVEDPPEWLLYKDHRKNVDEARKFDYQLCGVHNRLYLYPKDPNIDIIYVNKQVESKSKFSVIFQVMDYKLLVSVKTNFRFLEDDKITLQHSLLINHKIQFEILYLRVSKLRVLIIQIYSGKLCSAFDGPTIGVGSIIKNTTGVIKLSTFQCFLLCFENQTHYFRYSSVERTVTQKLILGENKIVIREFPTTQCKYRYGKYCIFMVSLYFIHTHLFMKTIFLYHYFCSL